MNEIYPMWVRAHGIMILSAVNWLHTSSTFKLMIDRFGMRRRRQPRPHFDVR